MYKWVKGTAPNKSIHPRVVNGRTAHPKVNTAKPWGGHGVLKARMDDRGRRCHARDLSVQQLTQSTSAAKLDWSKAFRMPGSMSGRKQ